MNRQLRLNIWLNLVYLGRNYLIMTVLGIMALLFIVILSMFSSGGHGAAGMFLQLHSLVSAAAFLAAVMIVYNPIKDRNVKMIITKPCLPDEWAAASFLTVNLISIALHLIILVFAVIMFVARPDAMGMNPSTYIYIWISSVMAVMVFSSLLLFLTFFMPPVPAVAMMILLNNVVIARIMDYCFNYTGGMIMGIFYKIIGAVFYVIYLVVPYFSMENIMQAGQSADKDWPHLAVFTVYGFVTLGFYYLMSVYVVKKRNLI